MTRESIQSNDLLNELGISLRDWQNEVRRLVDKRNGINSGMLGSIQYLIPSDNEGVAAEITHQFHQRVDEIKKFFQDHFPEAAILHLVFTDEPVLSSISWGLHEIINNSDAASKIGMACQAHGWKGEIIVRFDDESLHPQSEQSGVKAIRQTFDVINDLSQKSGPILFIIDGYGQVAINRGFIMNQGFTESTDEFGTVLIRCAENQGELDAQAGGISSVWGLANSVSKDHGLSNSNNKPSEFDATKVNEIANVFNSALARTKAGQKIAIRAPFRWGKSTAIRALNTLNPSRFSIVQADELGNLRYMNGKIVPAERYQDLMDILIVDEAGRGNVEPTLGKLEEAGKKILRIYPGNSPIPEGIKVMDIGN